jgi:hypothetical protein
MAQDWTMCAPHAELSGSEYGVAIHAAHLESDKLELTNYWHGLYVALATCSPATLKQEWEYICRVSDHNSPMFNYLQELKDNRKQALQGV